MGIFDGMNTAQTGGRRYLDPGVYTLKILKIGSKEAKDSFKGHPSFFVECEVVTSDCKSCPPGTLVSWAQPIKADKTSRDAAISNIRQFLAAALGQMLIFDTVDPQTQQKPSAELFADAACSAAQPFRDRYVSVKCTLKTTRTGNEFTKHDWFPNT